MPHNLKIVPTRMASTYQHMHRINRTFSVALLRRTSVSSSDIPADRPFLSFHFAYVPYLRKISPPFPPPLSKKAPVKYRADGVTYTSQKKRRPLWSAQGCFGRQQAA